MSFPAGYALSSDGALGRDQYRHLMTATPEPPRRKAARFLGRFSTGRDSARHDIVSMSVRAYQFVINDLRPFTQLGPTNSNHLCPPTSAIVAVDRAARNRPCSRAQSNPHSACGPAAVRPIAVSSLGGFRTRPPESVATSSGAPVNIVRQVVWCTTALPTTPTPRTCG